MNKNHKIKKINKGEYGYLVLSIDSTRLDDYLSNVALSLKRKKYNGSVIFDLLMSNGNKDRYYSALFDGNRFNLNSFRQIESTDCMITKSSNSFYLKNLNLIESSDIPRSKKFLIKKEISLSC